jgi:glutathione synthase/RimK-type ligase-like ATP-grasp enzyme
MVDPSVLLVGHPDDEHCDELEKLLRTRSRVDVVRLSLRDLPKGLFTWDPRGELLLNGNAISAIAGFWRRPGSPDVSTFDERFAAFVERESRDALVGGLLTSTVRWLTHPSSLWEAELKIVQLNCASDLGLAIPETLVTNDKERALRFASSLENVVVKPVRYGLLAAEPEPLVAWTSRVTNQQLGKLEGPPVILQREVRANGHLRVVTVGRRTFVARLDTDRLDWREQLENHERFKVVGTDEFLDVRSQACALAESLELGLSAQDWILAAEGPLFLEANPSGQWLFLDVAMAGELSAAVADELEHLAGA